MTMRWGTLTALLLLLAAAGQAASPPAPPWTKIQLKTATTNLDVTGIIIAGTSLSSESYSNRTASGGGGVIATLTLNGGGGGSGGLTTNDLWAIGNTNWVQYPLLTNIINSLALVQANNGDSTLSNFFLTTFAPAGNSNVVETLATTLAAGNDAEGASLTNVNRIATGWIADINGTDYINVNEHKAVGTTLWEFWNADLFDGYNSDAFLLTNATLNLLRLADGSTLTGLNVAASGGLTTNATWCSVVSPPYNAVGDGVTDCTAAFNAAIAACTELYIPPGTYVVSNLHLGSVAKVSGGGTLKRKASATGNLITISNACDWSVNVWGGDSTHKTNVASAASSSSAFGLIGAVGTRIHDCTIFGFVSNGINFVDSATVRTVNASVDNVTIINCWTGIYLPANAEYVRLNGNKINFCRYGINDEAGNVTITGNQVNDNGYGIIVSRTGSNPGHGQIVGNSINHNWLGNVVLQNLNIGQTVVGNSIFAGDITVANCSNLNWSANQIGVAALNFSGGGTNFFMFDTFHQTYANAINHNVGGSNDACFVVQLTNSPAGVVADIYLPKTSGTGATYTFTNDTSAAAGSIVGTNGNIIGIGSGAAVSTATNVTINILTNGVLSAATSNINFIAGTNISSINATQNGAQLDVIVNAATQSGGTTTNILRWMELTHTNNQALPTGVYTTAQWNRVVTNTLSDILDYSPSGLFTTKMARVLRFTSLNAINKGANSTIHAAEIQTNAPGGTPTAYRRVAAPISTSTGSSFPQSAPFALPYASNTVVSLALFPGTASLASNIVVGTAGELSPILVIEDCGGPP